MISQDDPIEIVKALRDLYQAQSEESVNASGDPIDSGRVMG
jgi:hypothetical protein